MAAKDKVAVVTGAGSGIGRASAVALLEAGYAVAVAGRREDALAETVKLGGRPERTLALPTDVADEAAVDALFAKTVERFGRVDVLFNNAGGGTPSISLDEMALADWNRVVAANLTGVFLCTRAAMRVMRDQRPMGGRIINNGSISAHVPRPGSAPYTATKHGVTGLTRSTSLDGRKYDIACGQIDIGNAETPLASRMKDGVPQANGEIRPEPLMDVRHVADAIVYMASLPLDANVQFLTVMATKMPFIGRG